MNFPNKIGSSPNFAADKYSIQYASSNLPQYLDLISKKNSK